MGKRELLILGCMAGLLTGCDNSDNGDNPSQCDSKTYQAVCDGNKLSRCINGEILHSDCQYGCEDGACRETPTNPCADGAKQCDGKQPQICQNGAWQNNGSACADACTDGDCQTAGCADGAKQCDGKQPQICQNGAWQNNGSACADSCTDGDCRTAAPACGSGGAVCDKSNFNGKTCADFLDIPAKADATGTLSCNDDCTINSTQCDITYCGNNYLDIYEDEFCDIVNGNLEFYSAGEISCQLLNAKNCGTEGQPTCYEYEEGGLPGCSADCKSISKGTCKIKAQPMDGIKTCEFSSLSYDAASHEIVANARVTTDEGLGQTAVSGQFVCAASTDSPTYMWNLGKADARFMTECEDCAADEYALIADATLDTLPAGTYSCVFMVHVNAGQASSSLYLCPVSEGYPAVQGTASDSYLRTFDVSQTDVEGTILAQWAFAGYNGTDKKTVTSVAAESGAASDSAMLSVSDNSMITMLSGTGGSADGAASINNLPTGTALDCKTMKHFVISLNTTGYKNIRISFAAAASGSSEMQVAVTQNFPDTCAQINTFTTPGSRNFKASPTITAANADNLSHAGFGIYMWNAGDQNQSLRIDDIIITGDPVDTPAQ